MQTRLVTAISRIFAIGGAGNAMAQADVLEEADAPEEVIFTGIRGSLSRARDIKRDATVNVTTHRPFDLPGFRVFASAKAGYEVLSEETRPPPGAFLISDTFTAMRC